MISYEISPSFSSWTQSLEVLLASTASCPIGRGMSAVQGGSTLGPPGWSWLKAPGPPCTPAGNVRSVSGFLIQDAHLQGETPSPDQVSCSTHT